MAAVGGSIQTINIDGRGFPVPADAVCNRAIGGFSNEVEVNGDGSGRLVKTRVPGMFDGLSVEIDDTRGDAEFLQAIANAGTFVTTSVTYVNNVVWQGQMQLTGDLNHDSMKTTMPISLKSTGILTRQS